MPRLKSAKYFILIPIILLLGCEPYYQFKYSELIEKCQSGWVEDEIVTDLKKHAAPYLRQSSKLVATKVCSQSISKIFGLTEHESFYIEFSGGQFGHIKLSTYPPAVGEMIFNQISKKNRLDAKSYYADDIDLDTIKKQILGMARDQVDLLKIEIDGKQQDWVFVNTIYRERGINWGVNHDTHQGIDLFNKVEELLAKLPEPSKIIMDKQYYKKRIGDDVWTPRFTLPPYKSFFELDLLRE
jgi:hypothetical protein